MEKVMPLPVVAVLVPLALLVPVVVVLAVAYRRAGRAIDALDISAHARCGTCGEEFEAPMAELRRTHMTKSASRERTSVHGVALVTSRSYTTFQKRLECPACCERGWCEIANISELQAAAIGIVIRYFSGALVALLAVGFIASSLVRLIS